MFQFYLNPTFTHSPIKYFYGQLNKVIAKLRVVTDNINKYAHYYTQMDSDATFIPCVQFSRGRGWGEGQKI
jgi:hypothetical protein